MCHESPGSGAGSAVVQTVLNSTPINISAHHGNFSFFDENDMNTGYRTKFVVARGFGTTMYIFLTPVLVMLGVIGNVLSVYVFFRSKLRPHSTSQYLSALAISDSLFLILLLPPWLSTIEINGLFHRNGFCQIFVYVSYVACCVSAWLVIAFTVERFVAVKYPLHRNIFCTVKRARSIIGIIVSVSLVLNTPILIFAGPGEEECNINREKLAHAEMFNWLDTLMSFTAPLLTIIFLNTWIMIAVWRLQKERKRLLKESDLPPESRELAICQLGYPRCQQRVTRMLLIVSSVFVFFNLPAYVMRVLAYVYDVDTLFADDKWAVVHHVSAILFNANFGINFFLYCLNGQNFRRALRQVVPCCACLGRPIPATPGATARARIRARGAPISFTTSNGTEATNPTAAQAARPLHRRLTDSYILRWTFTSASVRRARRLGRAARLPRPERPGESRPTVETIEMDEIVPYPESPQRDEPRAAAPRPVTVTDRRNI